VQAGTAYQFRVRAYNYGGDSSYSNIAGATTPVGTAQLPAAPSGLTAAVISTRRVNLHWYDNSNNESAFVIQRSSDGVNWITLGQVGANITSVADVSTSRRTTYYYRVFAVNAVGYSAPTNVVAVRTPSLAAIPGTLAAHDAVFSSAHELRRLQTTR
jgi:titin